MVHYQSKTSLWTIVLLAFVRQSVYPDRLLNTLFGRVICTGAFSELRVEMRLKCLPFKVNLKL